MWRMGYLGRGSELPPHQLGGLGELCKLPQLGTQSFWGHFIAQVYRYCSENTYKRIVYYQLLKLTARPIFSVTSLVRVVLNHWGGVKRPNRPPPSRQIQHCWHHVFSRFSSNEKSKVSKQIYKHAVCLAY